jgi:hypothetical protein
MNRKFHVIPLRLDDVTPPDFISNFSNIEIGETELGSAAAAQILQGLYQSPHLVPDPAYGKHTYFSRAWQASDALAGTVSEALSSAGLRLVGDAEDLAEEWATPRRVPYFFYATDFGNRELHRRVAQTVEAVTGVSCRKGEYVSWSAKAGSVQRDILRAAAAASMVLADITGESSNVYIETGAALAAGVPVALLRKGPPGRPSFMLRDQQVYDYATDAELIGRAVRVTYPYRRFLRT